MLQDIQSVVMPKKQPPSSVDKLHGEFLEEQIKKRQEVEPDLNDALLAKDAGTSPSTISRIKAGDMAMSVKMALKLARRLFCHPGDLHTELIDFCTAPNFKHVNAYQKMAQLPPHQEERLLRYLDALHYEAHPDLKK